MLALALRRLGDDVDLRVADLGRPLPSPDGAFDDAVASLVLLPDFLQDKPAGSGFLGFLFFVLEAAS